MDGMHDLGGMHGFGPVPEDDAIFHAEWERFTYAMNKLIMLQGMKNIHESRHAIERIDPQSYLALPYFGRWIDSIQRSCEETGVFDEGEVRERVEEIAAGEYEVPERDDPVLAREARELIRTDRFSRVDDGPEPTFSPGDDVVVRNRHPAGHTRAPRYTRRAQGVVRKYHGAFPLPDAAVRGREVPEPVYSVTFTHRELWGPDYPETDTLHIDMWESYIEAGNEDGRA